VNKNTVYPTDHSSGLQDNLILEHYGLNELNYESVKSYRERFAAVKPNHPWNGLETKEFLYKIGAWGKLRNSSKEGVTLAGLLMFSEERIITEVLPQYFLEYRENLSNIVNGTWSKRFTSQDGTWSGNVYDFYFKVMSHIAADSFAEPAIRSALHEALINAIVHCDYDGEGGIVIEKEQNLFRFSNPGLFRPSIEQAFEGGISNLRNPNLFKMFILIGLCKRAGSGLKSIELTWKQQYWPKPELVQHLQSKRTILTLSILANVHQHEDHTSNIDKELDLFVTDVSAENDFVNKKINSVNKELNFINKEENSVNKVVNSGNNKTNSINKSINSLNKSVNSLNKSTNSVNKELNSVNNNKVSRSMKQMEEKVNNTIGNQTDQEDELWRIAELARKKKRLSPTIMEEIILQLCSKRPLMLKELAYLLERTPDGLRNNYLAKLLNEGKIKLKYPDQPNHPKQAYMIAK
jgi:ATP-dependent DNA helicase RecG